MRTSNLEREIARNRSPIGKNCQKESQASKTRQEGQQEGQEEVQKPKNNQKKVVRDIDPASGELQRSYNGAATGVIFAVDVVPLSILAS